MARAEGDGEEGGPGCLPEPGSNRIYVEGSWFPLIDENVKQVKGELTYDESDWGEQDSGRYRMSHMGGTDSPDGKTRTSEAKVDIYLWAEDEDEVKVEGKAWAVYQYEFKTTCQPLSGHSLPPFGDSIHVIHSRADIRYTVTSTQNSSARAIGASLAAELPTGRTVRSEIEAKDNSAPKREVSWALGGQSSSESTKDVSGSSVSGAVQDAVTKAGTKGLSGTVTFTYNVQWTDNAALAMAETIAATDHLVLRPKCHALSTLAFESSRISASAVLGSGFFGEHEELTAKLGVSTRSLLQWGPHQLCGTPLPAPITPIPGGAVTPTATSSGNAVGIGQARRATTATDPGTTPATPVVGFRVDVEDASGATCFLRVEPASEERIEFLGAGTATAIGADIPAGSFAFSPGEPIAVPEGIWQLTVPVVPIEPGIAHAELSFDPGFEEDQSARAVLEIVDEPFTFSAWTVGQHSGNDLLAAPIAAGGPGERIWIESLWSEDSMLGEPTVTSSVLSGDPSPWALAPTVAFDEDLGRWYLTMAPSAPATVDVAVTFAGHTVHVPVAWAEGVPDDEDDAEEGVEQPLND